MSEYVSGPWEAHGKYIQLPDDKKYKTIAEVRYPTHDIPYPEEKFEPTIKLMAAAPELLEAAEEMFKIINHNGLNNSIPVNSEIETIKDFKDKKKSWFKAIKKAKGKGDNDE